MLAPHWPVLTLGLQDTRQPSVSPAPPPAHLPPAAPPRCLRVLLLRQARRKPESKRTTAGHGQTSCCLLRAPGCPAAPGHTAARNTSYRPATWSLQPMSRHVFPTRDNPKNREVGGGGGRRVTVSHGNKCMRSGGQGWRARHPGLVL